VDARTRAVFLTHYGGLMADLNGLRAVLTGRNVTVVEDCAHAHGSAIRGRRAGAWRNVACYSFQSMKNISTLGQGGLMVLPDEEMAKRVRRMIAVEPDADFAPRPVAGELGPYRAAPPSLFTHDKNAFTHDCTALHRHGTNSTLPEPAAAAGRVQLRRIGEFLAGRARVAARLDGHLSAMDGVRPQRTPPGQTHSHHLYTCFVDPRIGNEAVGAAMVERGVEIQQRYFPLHLLPEWRARGGRPGQCPVAERVWFREQLNLPISPHMSDDQVDLVAEVLRDALAAA
jgi:perosamine synthetase